jgi:catechol-2,3-dioxygenase
MRSADVPRLERFYCGLLAIPVVRRDESRGSVWLDAQGVILMLEPLRSGEAGIPAGSMELIAFEAGSLGGLPEAREHLARAGILIEAETAHTLYFRDPDGRRVAVSDYSFA